jgi:branched-chain amino acid transport system permease protein
MTGGTMLNFVQQTLNGLTFAGLLFLLGSGFALTFGLMRIVNVAYGSAFLVGGYVGYSTISATGSFWLAALAGASAMGAAGFLLERGLLRRVVGDEMSQFLLTMGVSFIAADFALVTWGGNPVGIELPGVLARSSHFGSITYPNNRLFILFVAAMIAIGLWMLLSRTRAGAIVRAGVDDREMVSTLGINVSLVFSAVFTLGMCLAGLAGVLGGNLLGLAPGVDSEILIYMFALVIIGGRGTLAGAIAGSLVVGLVITYGNAYFPSLAYFSLFAPMVAILLLRPQGLFGRGAA